MKPKCFIWNQTEPFETESNQTIEVQLQFNILKLHLIGCDCDLCLKLHHSLSYLKTFRCDFATTFKIIDNLHEIMLPCFSMESCPRDMPMRRCAFDYLVSNNWEFIEDFVSCYWMLIIENLREMLPPHHPQSSKKIWSSFGYWMSKFSKYPRGFVPTLSYAASKILIHFLLSDVKWLRICKKFFFLLLDVDNWKFIRDSTFCYRISNISKSTGDLALASSLSLRICISKFTISLFKIQTYSHDSTTIILLYLLKYMIFTTTITFCLKLNSPNLEKNS